VAPRQQRLLHAVGEDAVAASGGARHGAGVNPQARGRRGVRRRGLQGLVRPVADMGSEGARPGQA
jgi:hypothetical protein